MRSLAALFKPVFLIPCPTFFSHSVRHLLTPYGILKIILFIFGFFRGFYLIVAIGGHSLVAVHELLTAVASLIGEHRL